MGVFSCHFRFFTKLVYTTGPSWQRRRWYMPDGLSRNNEEGGPCAARYLEVAVAELDCEPLLASVRHGLAVGVHGYGCLSPASAIEPFLLKDIKLSGRNPTFTSTMTSVRRCIGNNAPGPGY